MAFNVSLNPNDVSTSAFLVRPLVLRPNPVGKVQPAQFFQDHLRDLAGRTFGLVEEASRAVQVDLRDRSAVLTLPMIVPDVMIHGQVQRLRRPLSVLATYGPESLELEVADLGIYVSGPDVASLQSELSEEMDVLVEKFMMAPDSELAPSGLELKKKLQEIVGT